MESEARERVVLDVRRSEKDINDLYKAAVEGDVAVLSALLRRDPLILNQVSLTSLSETCLHIASSLGHVAFARALVEKKPALAIELDSLARSPLHLASAEGHVDVVKLLLRAAPCACILVDRDDRIPLHLAAIKGRVEVLEELIRACPDSTKVTLNGDNVAHLCVKYCRLEALMLLLGNDSGHQLLNSKDGEGNNVLHLAVMLNHFKVVKYLGSLRGIKEKANELNQDGHTALDVFYKGQNKDFNSFGIQQVLLEIGVSRAKHPNGNTSNVNSTTLVRKPWDRLKKFVRCFRSHPDWIKESHGNLMVVATVIAGMCFQAIMNPPGGVWQQDTDTGYTCNKTNVCYAGTPVMAYGGSRGIYFDFIKAATKAFVLSLIVIALHFSGHLVESKGVALVVIMITWYVLAYLCTVLVEGMIMLNVVYFDDKRPVDTTIIAVFVWYPLLFFVLIHTIRTVHWLLHRLGFFRRFWKIVRIFISAIMYVICVLIVFRTFHYPLSGPDSPEGESQ